MSLGKKILLTLIFIPIIIGVSYLYLKEKKKKHVNTDLSVYIPEDYSYYFDLRNVSALLSENKKSLALNEIDFLLSKIGAIGLEDEIKSIKNLYSNSFFKTELNHHTGVILKNEKNKTLFTIVQNVTISKSEFGSFINDYFDGAANMKPLEINGRKITSLAIGNRLFYYEIKNNVLFFSNSQFFLSDVLKTTGYKLNKSIDIELQKMLSGESIGFFAANSAFTNSSLSKLTHQNCKLNFPLAGEIIIKKNIVSFNLYSLKNTKYNENYAVNLSQFPIFSSFILPVNYHESNEEKKWGFLTEMFNEKILINRDVNKKDSTDNSIYSIDKSIILKNNDSTHYQFKYFGFDFFNRQCFFNDTVKWFWYNNALNNGNNLASDAFSNNNQNQMKSGVSDFYFERSDNAKKMVYSRINNRIKNTCVNYELREHSAFLFDNLYSIPLVDKMIKEIEFAEIPNGLKIALMASENEISGISLTGKLRWTFKTTSPIDSKLFIKQIKGKGEIVLFNTADKIFALNTDGENIKGFPISVKEKINGSISVYSSRGKDDLRITFFGQNNKAYNFDENGKPVSDWNITEFKTKNKTSLIGFNYNEERFYMSLNKKDEVILIKRKGYLKFVKDTAFSSYNARNIALVNNSPLLCDIDSTGKITYSFWGNNSKIITSGLAGASLIEPLYFKNDIYFIINVGSNRFMVNQKGQVVYKTISNKSFSNYFNNDDFFVWFDGSKIHVSNEIGNNSKVALIDSDSPAKIERISKNEYLLLHLKNNKLECKLFKSE